MKLDQLMKDLKQDEIFGKVDAGKLNLFQLFSILIYFTIRFFLYIFTVFVIHVSFFIYFRYVHS